MTRKKDEPKSKKIGRDIYKTGRKVGKKGRRFWHDTEKFGRDVGKKIGRFASRGRGWHGQPTRHKYAGMGISTNINDKWRFNVNDLVARGKDDDFDEKHQVRAYEWERLDELPADWNLHPISKDFEYKSDFEEALWNLEGYKPLAWSGNIRSLFYNPKKGILIEEVEGDITIYKNPSESTIENLVQTYPKGEVSLGERYDSRFERSKGKKKLNPSNYESSSKFKREYYDEHGVGSWMDDLKLEIMWRKANNKELEDYMKEMVEED